MRSTVLVLLALAACGQTQAQPAPQECPACPECKPEPAEPPTEAEAWAVIVEAAIAGDGIGMETCHLKDALFGRALFAKDPAVQKALEQPLERLKAHLDALPGGLGECK